MKALVYIACILAITTYVNCQLSHLYEIADEISLPREEMDNCLAESGLQHELQAKLHSLRPSAKTTPEKMKEIKKKLGCFVWCIMEKKELTNGTVPDAPRIHNLLDKVSMKHNPPPIMLAEAHQLIERCLKTAMVNTDSCDLAYAFIECINIGY